jgi:hypothetical protein
MAYRQYTQCCSVSGHIGKVAAQILIAAAASALPLLFGASLIPGVLIVILGAIIAYCRWWLYDRLICLGGDVCAAGWVLSVEPPEKKSGLDSFDTDYSFNLVLAPHLEGATQVSVESDGIQGNLIKEQPAIAGAGLDWTGHSAQQWGNSPMTAVLHCEFEGGGVMTLLNAALAALAFATAAAVACSIPVFGWIACAILQIVAAVIIVVGVVAALNDKGNPNDLDTNLGEIHANDPTGRGADLLVVKGTWVYDSAHEGWNEIHPIKHCQRIGTWGGNWAEVGDAKAWADGWCKILDRASDPATITAQAKPENQWVIHPLIDGCDPGPGPDPGPR